MAGLSLNMGAFGGGGQNGAYSGPVFGAEGPAGVPASMGYPDTSNAALLEFGPGGVAGGGRNPAAHSLFFGVACFAALIVLAWVLPR